MSLREKERERKKEREEEGRKSQAAAQSALVKPVREEQAPSPICASPPFATQYYSVTA